MKPDSAPPVDPALAVNSVPAAEVPSESKNGEPNNTGPHQNPKADVADLSNTGPHQGER